MKVRIPFLFFLFILFLSINSVKGQTSTARFLYWQPSAEAMSMGGTGVANPANSFAVYYNPAGMAFTSKPYFAASFMQPYSSFYNQTNSMLTVINPYGENFAAALTLNSFWIEPQIKTWETGPEELGGTDDAPTLFNPAHIQVKASFSMRLQNNLSWGVSASYLSIRYWKGKSKYSSALTRTVVFDVGIMAANFFENTTFGDFNEYPDAQSGVERKKGISFGISLLNLGPDIYFIDESEKDPPPSALLLGIDYRILNTQTIGGRIAVDFENRIFDEEKFFHLGGEIDLFREYAVRCGYNIYSADNENSFFTLGAGVNTRYGSLNIAWYEKYPVPTWQFDAKLEFGWL